VVDIDGRVRPQLALGNQFAAKRAVITRIMVSSVSARRALMVIAAAAALAGCGSSASTVTVAHTVTQQASISSSTSTSAVSPNNCQFANGRWVTNVLANPTSCVPDPTFATGDIKDDEQGVIPRCYSCTMAQWNAAERKAARDTTTAAATSTTASSATPPPPATTTSAVSALTEVNSGHANGAYAVAQTSGTASNPNPVELRLIATPSQDGRVSWDLVCDESGGGVGSKSGQSNLSMPGSEKLPVPSGSTSCIVSANVQLSGSGNVTIAIYDGS
jgi:hypothetical protein